MLLIIANTSKKFKGIRKLYGYLGFFCFLKVGGKRSTKLNLSANNPEIDMIIN